MGDDNIRIGNETATRKPARQMAGAMSQQDVHVMGDNHCTQQKLVRLVGCRDPNAQFNKAQSDKARVKAGLGQKTRQFD